MSDCGLYEQHVFPSVSWGHDDKAALNHHNHNPYTTMKLSTAHWMLCAAFAATAAASSAAKVMLFTPGMQPRTESSDDIIDPNTARLILAQRLGLGHHHSISDADEVAIRQINQWSAEQQPLFGQEKHAREVSRLLIVVEGMNMETCMKRCQEILRAELINHLQYQSGASSQPSMSHPHHIQPTPSSSSKPSPPKHLSKPQQPSQTHASPKH